SPGGKALKLESQIATVDNARESVDEKGVILGILANETLSGRMDRGISKVTERYPGLGGILNAVKGGVFKETNPDIDYQPGVEMTLKLTKPLTWAAPVPNTAVVCGIERGG